MQGTNARRSTDKKAIKNERWNGVEKKRKGRRSMISQLVSFSLPLEKTRVRRCAFWSKSRHLSSETRSMQGGAVVYA